MDSKDYFTIGISSVALVVSIFSNFFQKRKDDRRAIRKTLTDTLESITKINFENVKLSNSEDANLENTIELRRIYNSQRRVLVAHADYLILKYDLLVTEVDCNIMAGAYSNIGDYDQANIYWLKTIEKTHSNPLLHMNLRGYAIFLFSQGKIEAGRKRYSEALLVDMPDNDPNKKIKTDTYLMWANSEAINDNETEQRRLLYEAVRICSNIANKKLKLEMESRIRAYQKDPDTIPVSGAIQ